MNKILIQLLLTFLICFFTEIQAESDINANRLDESTLFEEISFVYSASKYEQHITEAPASVSIVTSDQITKYGYRTLGDVLASMKGVYTSYDRLYQRLGIRGFNRPGDYNYRILILVDGHRINDNVVDYNAIGTEFIVDIDDIKRVELVRGPASSLYGSNAFLGVINVITKHGRDIQGVAVTGEGGTYHTYKGKFEYGDKYKNGVEVYLSGTFNRSDGNSDVDIPGLGTAKNRDGEHTERGFAKLSYQDITLSGSFAQRTKDLSVPIATILNDSRTVFVDERAYFDLLFEHNYADIVDVQARFYYDYYRFDGDYAFSTDRLYQDDFVGQWWGTEIKLAKQIDSHRITLGGEYRNNFQQDIRSFESPPLSEFINSRETSSTYGIYLQDEVKILNNLTLNIGFRYDNYSAVGETINPRAALIYQPFKDTTIKLIYGQASRTPSSFETNYALSNTWIKSQNLKSEEITTYEVEIAQKINRNFNTSITPFFFQVEDIIELAGNGTVNNPNFYRNGTNINIYGLEFELTGQWENGWQSRFSYAYQQAKEENNSRLPQNSPVHLTKLNIIAPIWREKLFAGLEVQYTSQRNSVSENVPGFLLANFTVSSKDLLPRMEISGSLYNLLDRTYSDPSSPDLSAEKVKQNGRQFRIKLSYEF